MMMKNERKAIVVCDFTLQCESSYNMYYIVLMHVSITTNDF